MLRLEVEAPSQAALLDCCFQDDSVAFTAASDGFILRFYTLSIIIFSSFDYELFCLMMILTKYIFFEYSTRLSHFLLHIYTLFSSILFLFQVLIF